jgi:hypothetical protein
MNRYRNRLIEDRPTGALWRCQVSCYVWPSPVSSCPGPSNTASDMHIEETMSPVNGSPGSRSERGGGNLEWHDVSQALVCLGADKVNDRSVLTVPDCHLCTPVVPWPGAISVFLALLYSRSLVLAVSRHTFVRSSAHSIQGLKRRHAKSPEGERSPVSRSITCELPASSTPDHRFRLHSPPSAPL